MPQTQRRVGVGAVLAAVGGVALLVVLGIGDWFAEPSRTILELNDGAEEAALGALRTQADGFGLGTVASITTALTAIVGVSFLVSLATNTMRRRALRGTEVATAVSVGGLVVLALRLFAIPPTKLGFSGPSDVTSYVLSVTAELTPSVYGLIGLLAATFVALGSALQLRAIRVQSSRDEGTPTPEADPLARETAPAQARRSAAR